MKILIDTNRYRDFCKGDPDALRMIKTASFIGVPFIVLAELRCGFLCGVRARRNEAMLTQFLGSPRVSVLFPDRETTNHYAHLYAQLRLQGTPIPMNDLWIAALAIQHDLPLYSRDAHFECIPQLVVV